MCSLANRMRLAGLGLQTVVLFKMIRRLLLKDGADERRPAAHRELVPMSKSVYFQSKLRHQLPGELTPCDLGFSWRRVRQEFATLA